MENLSEEASFASRGAERSLYALESPELDDFFTLEPTEGAILLKNPGEGIPDCMGKPENKNAILSKGVSLSFVPDKNFSHNINDDDHTFEYAKMRAMSPLEGKAQNTKKTQYTTVKQETMSTQKQISPILCTALPEIGFEQVIESKVPENTVTKIPTAIEQFQRQVIDQNMIGETNIGCEKNVVCNEHAQFFRLPSDEISKAPQKIVSTSSNVAYSNQQNCFSSSKQSALPHKIQLKKRKRESNEASNIAEKESSGGLLDLLCSVSVNFGTRLEMGCRCVKTKCLKLYCDCFQSGKVCISTCACVGCMNTTEESSENGARMKMIREILKRRPDAFQKRVKKDDAGCACKNSRCIKKYCECFRAGRKCSDRCLCRHCQNTDDAAKHRLVFEANAASFANPMAWGSGILHNQFLHEK
mmetsp:Transcript_38485/g.56469  ORF Transcript_38485/g.56469 Transcript_38485/m.56469 type:complete len:415 (-) Transcript_38485:208-1452(-)